MENSTEIVQFLVVIVVFIAVWLVIRNIAKVLSNRINNVESYKEESLRVLEEIRDELKQINQNSASK